MPLVPHFVKSCSQHTAWIQELGPALHIIVAKVALVVTIMPAAHFAWAHVATAVQQSITCVSFLSLPALVESWYSFAPHVTPIVPHFVGSASQQTALSQLLAAPVHIVAEAAGFILVATTVHAAAHVAFVVQHEVTPLSMPIATLPLAESWYFPDAHFT